MRYVELPIALTSLPLASGCFSSSGSVPTVSEMSRTQAKTGATWRALPGLSCTPASEPTERKGAMPSASAKENCKAEQLRPGGDERVRGAKQEAHAGDDERGAEHQDQAEEDGRVHPITGAARKPDQSSGFSPPAMHRPIAMHSATKGSIFFSLVSLFGYTLSFLSALATTFDMAHSITLSPLWWNCRFRISASICFIGSEHQ